MKKKRFLSCLIFTIRVVKLEEQHSVKIYEKIFSILILTAITLPANSVELPVPPVNPVGDFHLMPKNTLSAPPKRATLSKNDIKNQYTIAFDRFMQSNVKSAYTDFKILIDTTHPDDFAYMHISERMADIGFFTLSELSISKMKDKEITDTITEDIKRFYFPAVKLKPDDEIYLGEMYSNIIYNAQSREASEELMKNIPLLQKSDYANYVAALGALKSGSTETANTYIDKAIAMNNANLNYKKLKAEILTYGKKPQDALKLAAYIKQQPLYSTEFIRKVNSLEQFILYKTRKTETLKNYHLGFYYYYENENTKAVRTLQSAISNKKKTNADVYALLSRVYFDMKDYDKAQDTALKALKIDGGKTYALAVLGDLAYREEDFKKALDYYQQAAKDKSTPDNSVKLAKTFDKLGKSRKADEIFTKVIKSYNNAYAAYYYIALSDKTKEISYLKKCLAQNNTFKDAWIDLARIEITRQNSEKAKNYLAIVKHIDENDFRYYYYQGLINKNEGLSEDALLNFQKSLILNPDFIPAKEELNI